MNAPPFDASHAAFAAWLEAQEWPVPAAAVAAPPAPKANGMVTPWADIVPGTDAQRLSDASAAKTVLTLCKGGTLCTRLAVAEAADAEPLRRGFLSHVSYVMDDEGFPCFPLADSLAAVNVRDTKKADGLAPASFFVHGTASTTLLGDVESFDVSTLSEYQLKLAAERSGMSEEVLTRTPWHRVVPQRVYYADPIRSSESWVAAGDYATSTANPLAAANAELIRRLSTKQLDLDRVAAALMGVPVDEVMSRPMSEHEPTRVAPRKTASGTSGVSGTRSLVADAFTVDQHEQSLCSQYGLSSPPNAVTLSPGTHRAR